MESIETQETRTFAGKYHSHEGSQFIGNSFSTNGPIYFDSNSDNRLPTSVFDVTHHLSPHFTGRSQELEEIQHALHDVDNDIPARCVVFGMPGLGKSQLALQYATLAYKESRFPWVFWVTASSVETVHRDFTRLVELLHLPGRHSLDQIAKLTAMRAWLEDAADARRWLLVVDNVNRETATALRDILPRRNKLGKILFTTRTEKVADLLSIPAKAHKLALQTPSIDDASTMLLADANREGENLDQASRTAIESLVKSVGSLPLAINQAASYMRETGSSAKLVLDIYKNEEVGEILTWENDLSQHEERSVAAAFAPAFKQLEHDMPDAITLLRVLSFLDPGGIPISILKQGSGALFQESEALNRRNAPKTASDRSLNKVVALSRSSARLSWATHQKQRAPPEVDSNHSLHNAIALFRSSPRLSKAIQGIDRLSLVVQRLERSDCVIWIHDLVQLLLRSKLMTNTERPQWLEIAICITCKAFDGIGDPRSPHNWIRYSEFVTHIQTMERFAEQYGLNSVNLMDASHWAAVYFRACGFYQEAASILARVCDKRKAVLGPEHPYTLQSMNNLAVVYEKQGRLNEAEKLQVHVMEAKRRTLGAEHPHTLQSMNNLAVVYEKQGRLNEAEKLQVHVMEAKRRTLGAEHPDTLQSMNNLAVVYEKQGRLNEAEKLQVHVMEAKRRTLGAEHPDTLQSMNNLAHVYKDQHRDDEAVEMMKLVVTLWTKVLGPDHPNTIVSTEWLRLWTEPEGTTQST